MKGYKGFNKGLICEGTNNGKKYHKQYTENTVFDEENAEVCKSGMHFCENPFDVLDYYGYVDENANVNEFAEVEALEEVKTDDNKKFCTKKLRVGAKIGIPGLVKAFVDYTKSKIDFDNAPSAATNTGNKSAATNTGDYSAATNTGDYSAATNTGDKSAATVEGKDSFAIATGIDGKASGPIGCYIAVAEWKLFGLEWKLIDFKSTKVDGEKIKANTFYKLVDGEFVEA